MANALTQFLNPETGGFGQGSLERAKAAGFSEQQIAAMLPSSGAKIVGRVAAAAVGMGDGTREVPLAQQRSSAPAPVQTPWKPETTNELTRFLNPQTGGFGQGSLAKAQAEGYTPQQIAELLPGSGIKTLGRVAASALGLGRGDSELSAGQVYQSAFTKSLENYREQFDTQLQEFQAESARQLNSLQQDYVTAKAERDEAKSRAEEYEKQKKAEEEMAASEQLSSLRSGTTVTGSPGTGLGSLSSGRPSYSVSTGGKSGGILDRAYQDIDPTDSVLNKDVAISSTRETTGSSDQRRTDARRKALASGSSASDYYAQRFG